MPTIACIDDLRDLARRRVPRAFFEYADSGSYSQDTLRANREDMKKILLRQRVMVDVSARDVSTTVIGQKLAMPLVLAPIGLLGMQHGDGEILAAQAANEAGIPFTLSTMSVGSIEDVAEGTGKPFWFQLYVIRDREFIKDLLARARAANCSALVLTVDLQVLGQRHRDVHNGLTVPLQIKLSNVLDVATKPAWIASIARAKRKTFGNIAGHVKGMENVNSLAQWTNQQFDPALNWKDVEWIKSQWGGKLIIKGILDVEDARIACDVGADGIVVSNHGGRQLDGAPSSISALPRVADAVGARTDILFDGGVRTGADLMRALALGAKCCMVGRPYVWGLGAMGKAGVAKAIECLRKELEVTMALTGTRNISEIGPQVLADWPRNTA
ncbi:MAG: L-lactate dehydrogenase [Pseudorhodoplanes sp.]|nr:L-lactate dehydrogenase [Pseudorhodoplanes sp.]GIK81992.1 MAG: alpha-hydroxy-acid oxidizing enzyme [Alphaproteobacteria bacterium]